MKSQFKRFSKSTLSVILVFCMLVSCVTAGIIATGAAKDDSENVGAISSHFYLIGNLTGNNWNSNQTNYKIDTSYGSDGKFYIEVNGVQDAWFALWNGSNRYAPSSSCEASSSNPNAASGDYDHSGNSWQYKGTASKIKICIDETVGTRDDKEWYPAVWVEEVASTPLSAPTLEYNSSTTSPVNITGSSASLTWADVSNASSYTVYKDGTAVQTNATSPYSATSTGSYTVKAIGNGTTYSDSDASNAIQLNFQKTTTIYVKSGLKNKNNGGPLTNAYIWSNDSDKWTGNWPGEAITGWTASGDYYYKSFTNAYSKFKVILQGNSAQTSDSEAYDTGKTYRIDSVNTEGDNGKAVLTEGAPADPACTSVSLSQSPSSGTIYTGETLVTYTASVTGAQSGVTYNFKVDGTSVQNTSSNTYTTTFASAGTKSVTVTVEKSGYGSVISSVVSTTVINRPSVYFKYDQTGGTTTKGLSGTAMTYDSTLGLYKLSVNLNKGSSGNWYYIVIYDSGDGANLSYNNGTLTETLRTATGYTVYSGDNNVDHPLHIVASVTGTYNFYYNESTNKLFVECPHTVTFDSKGGSAVQSQVVEYNGKATQPASNPTKTGYTFDKWVTTDGGSTAFNFSTTSITADTTVYAKWTQNSYTISYPSTTTGYTLGGSKPTSAHYGDTISFTVTPQTNYRIGSVQYTPEGGSATDCIAGDNNEYHFTMPDKNVQVTVNMIETRTVTLTAGTGFATKQYKIGNGSYSDYSAPFTVDKGSVVTFKVTYSNGYEYKSVTNATKTSNTIFTTSAINSNITVTIEAKKSTYNLIGVASPTQGGAVTFYSTYDNAVAGTSAITTAQIDNNVFAKYSPDSDRYRLSSFSKSGDGLSNLTVQSDTNIVKFKMGYSNATITANVVATTPTFTGTWSGMTVYANENFTYSNTGGGVSPTGCTYTYSFNGITDQASSAFTAPDRPGTYTLTIKASNKPAGISNAATATTSVSIKVIYREKTVTYYIDMHNNNMQDKTLDVAIVSNGSGSDESILKDSEGHNCIGDLLQQGNSTVYAASIATPATKVTNSDSYQPINLRIRYGPNNALVTKIVAIDSSYSTPLMDAVSPEVWLEANNEAANTYKVTYANNSTTAVQSGKKRLYVAKPLNWETAETSWTHLHLYHWGDYADIGWNSAPLMTHIGSDSNYHYYYIDVDSGIDNIIFQGWKNNSTSPDVQTENIEKIGSSNFFVLSKDNGKYYGTKSDENETVPGYTRYVSSVDMNVGETANIAPVNTGKKVIYSSNNNNVTVSEDGDVTATGSALATITVKVYGSVGARVTSANPGDVMTYECTVNVHNPGIFKGYRIISFDHQEYNVIIPTISGANPGYFNLDNASVVVNGLYDDATSTYITKYANSAIIEATNTIDVDGVGNDLPIEFTVKYAASNSNTGYSNITLDNATITTVSIKKSGQKRFGFKEWIPSQANITSSKTIDNGVETVVHKGLAFSSGTTTYQATFDEYKYVDVTFTFNYYEYNPELSEDGMVNYPYDETWAGSETFGNTFNKKMFTVTELADGTVKGSWAANVTAEAGTPCVTLDVSAVSSSGGDWYAWTWGEKSNGTWISGSRSGDIITFADNVVDNNIIFVRMNAGAARDWDNAQNKTADLSSRSHNLKTYTVSNYEVRGLTANGEDDKITSDNLVADTVKAIGVMPTNNYYDYGIDSSTINITSRNAGTYSAAVTVNMTQSPQEYKVYLNGNLKPRRNPSDLNDNRTYYYYQEYAEPIVDDPPTANSFYNWYAVDSSASDASTDNAPLLATNVNSYKFRVKGSAKSTNTYLRTAAATNPHGNDFLRSEVDFSHYEVTHQGSSPTSMKEYLMQNFYIADFFSPAEVLDPKSYTGKGKFGVAYKVEEVTAFTTASSGNITVYFTDSLDWDNICIYYWGENINNINWPGLSMTQYGTDADGKKIYSAEIPGTAEGVIFTGNNNQTVDITNNIANGSHWKSKSETVQNGIPYDDAKFVGGGVVYYSVDEQGNPRSSNAKDFGYVNGDGTLNQDAVKEMLKSEILASVNEGNYGKYTVEEDGQTVQKSVSYESLENAIGTEDALKVAYGTEIEAHQYVENSIKSGVLYRYLPLETFSKDSEKWSNGVPVKDENGNYYTTLNNNTFRYSNSLQSYQYVYASGNENKETNTGKNMRLYSYFVYSYTAYNQETNVPETRYEIVISDNYSDASTYWKGNPNPDPSN